jgi:hypothetical protein
VTCGAFLDGTQLVHGPAHVHGLPLIEGTVAAVVRERRNRRLVTWPGHLPIVRRALYAPVEHARNAGYPIGDDVTGWVVVDVSRDKHNELLPMHPGALRGAAINRIREARESAECELAETWCRRADAPLFIDGGIATSRVVASAACAVGVIKSHQTLYADGEGMRQIMALRRGERSSVFRVDSGTRTPVVSWYLRLRDPRGQDAMFGLVRVEVADQGNYAARANDVSRWILAEVTPLSLPDGRWDKMVYGVRDCEEFLRAIAS